MTGWRWTIRWWSGIWADHTIRLTRAWIAFQARFWKHRWFDITVALLFGLLAPPILESHWFMHFVHHVGLGGMFHHGGGHQGGGE